MASTGKEDADQTVESAKSQQDPGGQKGDEFRTLSSAWH